MLSRRCRPLASLLLVLFVLLASSATPHIAPVAAQPALPWLFELVDGDMGTPPEEYVSQQARLDTHGLRLDSQGGAGVAYTSIDPTTPVTGNVAMAGLRYLTRDAGAGWSVVVSAAVPGLAIPPVLALQELSHPQFGLLRAWADVPSVTYGALTAGTLGTRDLPLDASPIGTVIEMAPPDEAVMAYGAYYSGQEIAATSLVTLTSDLSLASPYSAKRPFCSRRSVPRRYGRDAG